MDIADNKIKTIFIGTPEFSVPILRSLIKAGFDISLVITQPDKPAGRLHIKTPTPVKTEAENNNLRILQPVRIKEIAEEINKLEPEIIVVSAYSQLLPKEILEIPKLGSINVHASLLPKYRGASCIQSAILNGDKETGITFIKMDQGLDTGPIIHQESLAITDDDTAGSLSEKLSQLASDILPAVVLGYIADDYELKSQPIGSGGFAKEIKKADALIDWSLPAQKIWYLVRAMQPWPVAYCKYNSKILKIYSSKPAELSGHKIGEAFIHENSLVVQCGQGSIILETLKYEGGNIMPSSDFINGHSSIIGKILG
jgi:methionyl-tRNA formyltransferase